MPFFISLLLHELGHALQARREGIPVTAIDLGMLGGVRAGLAGLHVSDVMTAEPLTIDAEASADVMRAARVRARAAA